MSLHFHQAEGFYTDCNPVNNGVTPKNKSSRQQVRAANREAIMNEVRTKFRGKNAWRGEMTRKNARRIARSIAKRTAATKAMTA